MIVFQPHQEHCIDYAVPLWIMSIVHTPLHTALQMNIRIWKQKSKNARLPTKWNLYAITELVGAQRILMLTHYNMATDQLKDPVNYLKHATPMEFAEVIFGISRDLFAILYSLYHLLEVINCIFL